MIVLSYRKLAHHYGDYDTMADRMLDFDLVPPHPQTWATWKHRDQIPAKWQATFFLLLWWDNIPPTYIIEMNGVSAPDRAPGQPDLFDGTEWEPAKDLASLRRKT